MDSEDGLALGLGATLSGVGLEAVYSKAEESMFDLKNAHTSVRFGMEYGDPNPPKPPGSPTNFIRKSVGQKAFERNQIETGNSATSSRLLPATAEMLERGSNYGSMEYTGLGISASIAAGEGSTFTIGYSRREGETNGAATSYAYSVDGTGTLFDDDTTNDPAETPVANQAVASLSSEVSKIELGLTYDLGGGATLKGSVKKEDHEITNTFSAVGNTNLVDSSGDNPAVKSVSSMETDSITTLELKIAFSF